MEHDNLSHAQRLMQETNDVLEREAAIDRLWERSGHGTRREDVVAAYHAGAAAERKACAQLCESLNVYDELNPAGSFADAIRARSGAIDYAAIYDDTQPDVKRAKDRAAKIREISEREVGIPARGKS